jgi:hypothetical protein
MQSSVKIKKGQVVQPEIADVSGLQLALDVKLNEAPTDGSTYGRKDGNWEAIVSNQNLQSVTDNGDTTTNKLRTENTAANYTEIQGNTIIQQAANGNNSFISPTSTQHYSGDAYAVLSPGALLLSNDTNIGTIAIETDEVTADYAIKIPSKPYLSTETFAMISDLGNLPTDDQKAAMGNASLPSASNPFITASQIAGNMSQDLHSILSNGNSSPLNAIIEDGVQVGVASEGSATTLLDGEIYRGTPTSGQSLKFAPTTTNETIFIPNKSGTIALIEDLDNVDNTSDLNKPISIATQNALNGKENTLTKGNVTTTTLGVTVGGSPTASVIGTGVTINIQNATTSQNGLLTSTDWNTFNNKQNTLTNPNTGTGTANYISKFTGTTTQGNSLIFDNGTNVGISTTSPADKLHIEGGVRIKNAWLQSIDNASLASGTQTVATIAVGTYRAAFFDYVAVNGTNVRAGTVMATWLNTTIEWVDTSTNDIGNTSDLILQAVISGSNVLLQSVTTTGTWSVKTLIRML